MGGRSLRIFATVGTDHHPFDRLVTWVDEWVRDIAPDADCFIQYGSAQAPRVAEGEPMLDPIPWAAKLRAANAIVTHGGPATIMAIRSAGMVPIVVPRDSALGEHVDGHQLAFARHLESRGQAEVARTQTELADLLKRSLEEPEQFTLAAAAAGPALDIFVSQIEDLIARGGVRPRWWRRNTPTNPRRT